MNTKQQTLNVLQLSMGFLFILLASNSQGFIQQAIINNEHAQGTINEHAGYISIAIIYGISTFANFLAAPIIGLLGVRWAMAIGAVTYAIFQAGFLFLNEPFLYFSSALLGVGGSVIWIGQGKYIAMNSTKETAGMHSSLFWGLSQISIVGCGLFLYFEFNDHSSKNKIDDSKITLFFIVLIAVVAVGSVILGLLRIPKQDEFLSDSKVEAEPEMTSKELLYSTFNLLKDRRMLFLSVAFAYTGIELSFWSGIYPASISFTKKLATNTETIMAFNAIAQGLGQVTAGLLFGILGDVAKKIGRIRIVLLGLIVHLLVFVAVYLNFPSDASLDETNNEGIIKPPSVLIALICAYFLGFGDACWNTQIFSILILKYNNKISEAFSLFFFFQSLMTTIAFIYASYSSMGIHMLVLVVTGVLGFIGFFIADKLPTVEQEAKDNFSSSVDDCKKAPDDFLKKSDRKIYAA
ncbi:hypothetical protein FO519_000853 [Halicephalobus sp. NKZ332]|nr:hypothetical protein FO519_000853 [Halicephalobus sp. NKZ332]